ncbi:asparagine synthase (glutamine-hydrolyzing) [Acidovorax sp. SUPP2522]|uniref:asparagine synthase (glutamine-hydrolyzing) n=1 Tax=unclassified Acidovorax TaxID=2684926 RepID=UPI002349BC91|nr:MULTISPECIES: asparagine synthase (glutamine-hydrolyzing) [unclassified Acidovorax]WCM98745.1 asparagine synthase (glutamine-hydrolyzing) [Acidovorax sp. GBBC 1281]GKT17835.1 asparagine synthase (glutamine-hydrolyzing) [Acidovorax sp. SUPP2522]
MCGIAGYFNTDQYPASAVVIKRMTDAIAHRGPDGEGSYVHEALALGHRRLAIIDLSPGGHQPKASEDGRYVITYNGEIYNFKEIRMELESLGRHFHTHSDTEVLLYAFVEWGVKCFSRLNGMFALAIWDNAEKTLTLARDRYGVKPLYYHNSGKSFVFGSEIKAIFAHGVVDPKVDSIGLFEYLSFQNFLADRTIFSGISLFPAGTFATVKSSNTGSAEARFTRYWDYEFVEPESPRNLEEYAEELDRLFVQAVSRQLVSDVDIGSYLSGGMDSGSITAVAAQQIPYMKTFTCGFDLNSASGIELGFDERPTAEYMSYLFKTEHYEMVLKAGDMERVMPKLAWHIEEPRVGQSYPNYYAAQLASKFVKVVLSGAGGDELFGGYPWRYYRAVVNNDFDHYIDKYHAFWQRLIPQGRMSAALAPVWAEVQHIDSRDLFKSVFHQRPQNIGRPEDYINHSLYFEARTFLHGLLVVEDKLSMAHGIETRVPFLDNDLVDFSMQLPARMKLGNLGEVVKLNENEPGAKTAKYFQKTKDGKLLLRQVMQRLLPPVITDREKQGFSAPDASWFKGESIDYVKRTLLSPNALTHQYLNRDYVSEIVRQHGSGEMNHRLQIWSLISLESMIRQFIKNE